MLLHVSDPIYGGRLASFLRGLDHRAHVVAPGNVEVNRPTTTTRADIELELRIYLRVWRSLYPDADVTLVEA